MKKSLIFSACVITGLGVVQFFSEQGARPSVAEQPSVNAAEIVFVGEKTLAPEAITALVETASEPDLAFAAFIQTLPASLAGQPAPESLTVNDQGELVVDGKIRFLFEHYLSALGEESLDNIVARIHHALQTQLAGANLDKALALMESYLQYRNYLGEVKNDFISANSGKGYELARVAQMKQLVQAERLRFFSEADSAALFLQDDQYDDYQMQRARVIADPRLTPEQQQTALLDIDEQAPDWIVASETQASLVARVRAEEKALVAQGADPETLYSTRVKAYGEDAAQRLALVDQENQQWQARVDGYQIELQSLLASGGGGSVDADLLQALRQAHFQGPELVRIAALDGDAEL
ncbi:lipase secretion chaperone [Simiduia curdlanivorans]|uniref:Lipase chaperone n=1 Tax=Simiduia curdlanivorans TaxID=1492769 RepID=A0ABV8V306_9GAMM|nr:lipase secretion chaperone [Simiduia curdlanivorans]MDN3640922.1 lipase secretion chaperone [Simiduia curdlanivorans]